jgi:hypothetical protein
VAVRLILDVVSHRTTGVEAGGTSDVFTVDDHRPIVSAVPLATIVPERSSIGTG